jgi:hypothetical protein
MSSSFSALKAVLTAGKYPTTLVFLNSFERLEKRTSSLTVGVKLGRDSFRIVSRASLGPLLKKPPFSSR